jgi:hypothetical protein
MREEPPQQLAPRLMEERGSGVQSGDRTHTAYDCT